MLFNVDKYKVMHMGYNNRHFDYLMSGSKLESVNEEKDLGIIVSDDLKWEKHCSAAVINTDRILLLLDIDILFQCRQCSDLSHHNSSCISFLFSSHNFTFIPIIITIQCVNFLKPGVIIWLHLECLAPSSANLHF